jgi:hypothetical protein
MLMRRLLAGGVAGAVLVTGAACGGDPTEGVAANLTRADFADEVATATESERSAHLEATLSFRGETMTMSGDIASAPRLEELRAQLDIEVPGQGPLDLRIVEGILYLKARGLSTEPGKSWVEVDLTDDSNPLAGFYRQIVANTNPAQSAKAFEAVTELENRGEETVDGVEAIRYEVTVDLAKAVDLSGAAGAGGADSEKLLDELPAEVTYDVWLETDTALMVRLALELQGMEMDMHFSAWGEPVAVAPPPAGQVAELDF